MDFRWNEWNIEPLANHGVEPDEAEAVAANATGQYPRHAGFGKFLVWGPGSGGRLLQVIFVIDDDGTAFVIHARELTAREKRVYRRRER
jgi:uncharacterized protein